mmetsp:Transcript_5854/g.8860  ORF Transcript_5854/g.8860 Transcript_5854/m.8860 type:complete len:329 (-) Transcript_5854:328-1314(-)
MHELVEAVLAVGAGLPKVQLPGLKGQHRAVRGHALAVALHVHLLYVSGEAEQGLAVGQEGTRAVAQETGVPHPQQTHQHRNVLSDGCVEEVLVHVAAPRQELLHHLKPVVQRQGHHPHRRAHTEAASDPVPEAEHVVGINAELLRLIQGRGHCRQMLTKHHTWIHSGNPLQEPVLQGAGVKHGLCCGEGLRHNHNQCGFWVHPFGGAGDVDGVDVRQEFEGAPLRGPFRRFFFLQGLEHKLGSEVAPADANGDDGLEGLTRAALPLATADFLGEGLDLGQHLVDVRHRVAPVDHHRRSSSSAQGKVAHSSVFSVVDVLSIEHCRPFAI